VNEERVLCRTRSSRRLLNTEGAWMKFSSVLRGDGRARARSIALAVAVAASIAGCGDEPQASPIADPLAERVTLQGPVIGFSDPMTGAHVWRGLPFAQPPVGEQRWRAPRPPLPWDGTRAALQHGPVCVQFAGPSGGPDGESAGSVVGSEDCLVLNVFAPAFDPNDIPTGANRLPVLFWIHGGGNTIGDTRIYDGSRLAVEQRVIVVAVQYRLGALG
jgi:para-nitrobenzyl esterase